MIGVHRVTRVFFFLSAVIFVASPPKMLESFFFFRIATTAMIAAPSKKTGSQRHRVFNSISVTHSVATCQVKIHKPFWTQFCRVGRTDYQWGAARTVKKSTVTENRIIALRAINVRWLGCIVLFVSISINRVRGLVRRSTSLCFVFLHHLASEKEWQTKREREEENETFARYSTGRIDWRRGVAASPICVNCVSG